MARLRCNQGDSPCQASQAIVALILHVTALRIPTPPRPVRLPSAGATGEDPGTIHPCNLVGGSDAGARSDDFCLVMDGAPYDDMITS